MHVVGVKFLFGSVLLTNGVEIVRVVGRLQTFLAGCTWFRV